jgi:hypothetical protein
VKGLSTFLIGLLFGAGLLLSGMTDPGKVRGFLDVAGTWDPSLAFVMVGAIGVHASALRLITKLRRPLAASSFSLPKSETIDRRLVAGAAIFGVGWGLSGICPGPAVVGLGIGWAAAVVFSLTAVAGVLAHGFFDADRSRTKRAPIASVSCSRE